MLTRLSAQELEHEAQLHGFTLVKTERIETLYGAAQYNSAHLPMSEERRTKEKTARVNALRRSMIAKLSEAGAFHSTEESDGRPHFPLITIREELTVIMPKKEQT